MKRKPHIMRSAGLWVCYTRDATCWCGFGATVCGAYADFKFQNGL